jgi:hypothetical protein
MPQEIRVMCTLAFERCNSKLCRKLLHQRGQRVQRRLVNHFMIQVMGEETGRSRTVRARTLCQKTNGHERRKVT